MSAPSGPSPAGSASSAGLTGSARSSWPAALPAPTPSIGKLRPLLAGTFAMAHAELRKLQHDNLDIFTRSVQPLLWLFIFGTALHHNRSLTVGTLDYRSYWPQV